MREMTVKLFIDEAQEKRLEKLLPYHQNYQYEDGSILEVYTLEKLFQSIMLAGSHYDIEERIAGEERRQQLIKERAASAGTPNGN